MCVCGGGGGGGEWMVSGSHFLYSVHVVVYWLFSISADYPKLVGLLQGKLVRVHDNHRIRLNEVTSLLYQRLNPSDVLPFLQQTGVIVLEEANTIRKVETHRSRGDSALELQYILPNRHRHWYELMIWSLVESGQTELAEKIDGSLTKGNIIKLIMHTLAEAAFFRSKQFSLLF